MCDPDDRPITNISEPCIFEIAAVHFSKIQKNDKCTEEITSLLNGIQLHKTTWIFIDHEAGEIIHW